MALPVLNTTPADAYFQIRAQGQQMRALCLQLQEQLAAGTVYAAFLLDVQASAIARIQEIPPLADVPGLGAYVKQQLADPDIDLTVPLQECIGTLMMLNSAIQAEYPKDAEGRLLDRSFGADGSVQWIALPAESLPQTGAAAASFLATLS